MGVGTKSKITVVAAPPPPPLPAPLPPSYPLWFVPPFNPLALLPTNILYVFPGDTFMVVTIFAPYPALPPPLEPLPLPPITVNVACVIGINWG